MSNGIWIAASGAAGQMAALDVAANNAANASTPSYKEERIVFQQHLIDAAKGGSSRSAMRYNGIRQIGGNHLDGSLKVTERGLDVAIRGEGFFAVQTASGERYTRAGSFQISQDGTLVAGDGSPVLNTALRPIKITTGPESVRINNSGTVEVNGDPVGQLRLVKFQAAAGLEREGHYLFRASEASGRPQVAPVQLDPGSIEMSNVSIVRGMADMVSATRSFDALEKMIDAFREAERSAATELMRVR